MNQKELEAKNDLDFYQLSGINKRIFDLFAIKARDAKKIPRGRQNKLSVGNRIIMMLIYYKQYITYKVIGTLFLISESNAYENIKLIEKSPLDVKNLKFQLKITF